MFLSILEEKQLELLPLVKTFSKNHYLVGGTAIALQIGHRRSIDFDLFTNQNIKLKRISRVLAESDFPDFHTIYQDKDQMHLIINNVKLTFFNYPYEITAGIKFEDIIKMPTLLDLAAMKALALGGRAKWKDYVDLYFLFKNYFTVEQVSAKAVELFKGRFNAKLFREQLSFYDDVNYEEKVFYMPDFERSDEEIKAFLTKVAISKI